MKKWYVMFAGIAISGLLGFIVPKLMTMLSNAKYYRTALDDIAAEYYGDMKIAEMLGDEVLIVAYDYNSRQPRFFSKWFDSMDEGIYDTYTRVAVGASAAAPTYFDPMAYDDMYGTPERLIDGGVIANNPALYSY